MNPSTARALNRINRRFYAEIADAFSATRRDPWPGWKRAVDKLQPTSGRGPRVLDLGCGNGRFASYLETEWGPDFDYRGIDHILYGLAPHDFACGLLLIVLLFEATRRSVGWAMVAVGALFILYNAYGNLLPDVVANRGFSFERIVRFQVFSGAGLFGTPLGIAARRSRTRSAPRRRRAACVRPGSGRAPPRDRRAAR